MFNEDCTYSYHHRPTARRQCKSHQLNLITVTKNRNQEIKINKTFNTSSLLCYVSRFSFTYCKKNLYR